MDGFVGEDDSLCAAVYLADELARLSEQAAFDVYVIGMFVQMDVKLLHGEASLRPARGGRRYRFSISCLLVLAVFSRAKSASLSRCSMASRICAMACR